MTKKIAIHWFRQDLRLADNPSLQAAAAHGQVLPIYILDDHNAGDNVIGGAGRWWLHHSLNALNQSLDGQLRVFCGDAQKIILNLCQRHSITAVFWNRCYEPWRMQRDQELKSHLTAQNIEAKSFNGSLLWEPWEIQKADGTPYKVFTPFYQKGCLHNGPKIRTPQGAPQSLPCAPGNFSEASLDSLKLLPKIPWDKQLEPHWEIGETGAQKALEQFAQTGIAHYKSGRDFPAKAHVSKLSPRLHWGELSPQQIWHRIQFTGDNENVAHFTRELGWREFSYSLLYHNPELPRKNLQSKFDRFPWQKNPDHLRRWQTGTTGYPIVDAGMRELWQTGYMHNRVRMIVGSFLVKNLRLHWHHGQSWFWDCLVDADLANNSASWQWIAGCGADAAPYFRIFNPITQGETFDPSGTYTRRYLPELANLPDRNLFKPWLTPTDILARAGIVLGRDYPKPIVDLKTSREQALAAFKGL